MERSASSSTPYVFSPNGDMPVLTRPQSEAQKKEFETVTFAENEVWGIDILISSGEDGKVRAKPVIRPAGQLLNFRNFPGPP